MGSTLVGNFGVPIDLNDLENEKKYSATKAYVCCLLVRSTPVVLG